MSEPASQRAEPGALSGADPADQTSAASQSVSAYDALRTLVADDLDRVNALIRERMTSDAAPLIPELAAHLIEAGGKRLRPVLTLASARLCGSKGDGHVKLAATVEFIHTATLLHDDVVDESALRRGRASANRLWGNKPSVLVGDFLFSRSFQLMVETGSLRVLEILSGASAVIAEGEVLQLSLANKLSEDDRLYMQVIRAKTAALFEAATRVGAVAAGAPAEVEEALAAYGDRLGVAFQIVDDALDYGGVEARLGKSVGDDFREGKTTLPVLLAYADGDAEERAFWARTIEKRRQETGDLEHALTLLRRHRAVERALERAAVFAQEARDALAALPADPVRERMTELADYVVTRAT